MTNTNTTASPAPAPVRRTWPELVALAEGACNGHRASGHMTAAARKAEKTRTPLGRHVTEETAREGIAEAVLTLAPEDLAAEHPSDAACRAVVLGGLKRQANAERQPVLARCGDEKGRGHSRALGEDEDHAMEFSPLEDAEVREAVAVTIAALPDCLRDTLVRLLAGAGAPAGMPAGTWYARKHRARKEFVAAYERETGTVLPETWRK